MPYFAPSFKQKVMAKNNHQKSATCGTTREQYVARGSENGAVVYDNFMGFPYQVSFLGVLEASGRNNRLYCNKI